MSLTERMMMKKRKIATSMLIKGVAAILAAVFLEICLFNFRAIQSRGYEPISEFSCFYREGITGLEDGSLLIDPEKGSEIVLGGFDTEIKNIYFQAVGAGENEGKRLDSI